MTTATAQDGHRAAERGAGALLPDELLDRAAALSDATNGADWALGDLVVEAIEEHKRYLPKSEIRRQLAARTRYQPSGIRAREAVSRFWDAADREEYAVLDWSHFRLAMRQRDPHGDLQHCIESADAFGGRPMPYSAYAAWVKERNGGQKPADPYALADRAKALLGQALDCANVPAEQRAAWQAALDALLDS